MLRYNKIRRHVAVLALLGLSSLPAAPAVAAGSIQVAQAWSRPTPPIGAMAAVYLTITNSGAKADRLLGATTPAAVSAEINETRLEGGVSKMRRLASLEISPGQTLRLTPGALHIMLLDIVRPFKAGALYPLTLTFRDAGAVTVEVRVRDEP
jgi:periplasmic copper chaperone A